MPPHVSCHDKILWHIFSYIFKKIHSFCTISFFFNFFKYLTQIGHSLVLLNSLPNIYCQLRNLNCLFTIHNILLLILPYSCAKFLDNILQTNAILCSPSYLPNYSLSNPFYANVGILETFLQNLSKLHYSPSTPQLIPVFKLHPSISAHTPSHVHFLMVSPSHQIFLLNT